MAMEEEAEARLRAGVIRAQRERARLKQRWDLKSKMVDAKRQRVLRNKNRMVAMGLAPPT